MDRGSGKCAGHGVQANGENYLIPIDADNIRSETQLRDRAVSLQFVLDCLSEAGNEFNMICWTPVATTPSVGDAAAAAAFR